MECFNEASLSVCLSVCILHSHSLTGLEPSCGPRSCAVACKFDQAPPGQLGASDHCGLTALGPTAGRLLCRGVWGLLPW